MRNILKVAIVIYAAIQIALKMGYQNPTDADFMVGTGSHDPIPKRVRYDSLLKKRDTTPYHGKWVDVE